ncbi:hypothetical protein ABIB40_001798 [Pedobacter sp. UYP30]|uniref:hypothetical protein n=1 Tax=Pedobacter sp. UYP30 TaxID=1756400 RepID=UPI0033942CF8
MNSLKALTKTRWKIEPNKVTIYPFGMILVIGVALAAVFSLILLSFIFLMPSLAGNLSIYLFIILMFLPCLIFGTTNIQFDNETGVMRKKLSGILPISIIRFNKLFGINVVNNLSGGYIYRIYRNDNRYGKGIAVSCNYGKKEDLNAILFVREVIPLIHAFLDKHAPLEKSTERIKNFKYFVQQQGNYIVKNNKVLPFIFSPILFFIGAHEISPFAWVGFESDFTKLLVSFALMVIGIAVFLATFTKISIDSTSGIVGRKGIFNRVNKVYNLKDFEGVRTVRKSVNFVYSGTDIYISFRNENQNKQESLLMRTLNKSKNITRFIAELNQIVAENNTAS